VTEVTSRQELGRPSRGSGVARRQVLRTGTAAAAVASLTAAAPSPARAAGAGADRPDRTRVALTRSSDAGIRSAQLRLGVRGTGRAPWTSAPLATDDFALLGVSWPAHAPTPTVEVRTRSGGRWSDWRELPLLDDRPDPEDDATLQHATQPLWVGSADGVRVRVSGNRPAHVLLSLIRPDVAPGDLETARRTSDRPVLGRAATGSSGTGGTVARPPILRRRDWNADESWRRGRASYNDTILQVHVHHTVSGNTYSRAETPGLIRGMYYYHTRTLGWSDLGYNFLVDRFGRIWEGRAGGIGKAVRGAHTLGFNTTSCGVSVIGNFEQVPADDAVVAGVAAVAAWKLARYGRDPLGTTKVVSEGSDKFGRSRQVTLPVIDGHRDTNDTACPGRYLYARLGDVRRAAQAVVAAAGVPVVTATSAPTLTGDPTPGATLTVSPGTFLPTTAVPTYTWLRDGVPIRKATRAQRLVTAADVGHVLSVVVTLGAEGHEPLVQRVDAAEPVRHVPTLAVTVSHEPGPSGTVRVAVAARVSVAEVADPGGTAHVKVDVGARTVPVVGGAAYVRVRRTPGQHVVRVTYSGTDLVRPAVLETTYDSASG
jgi:hypothetical protein